MNKNEMLYRLINYFSKGSKSQFANMLGLKAQTISAWLARNTFDAELIFTKCKVVSGDWLLSGEGEMLRDNEIIQKKMPASIIDDAGIDNNDKAFYQSQIEFLNQRIKALDERNTQLEKALIKLCNK